MKKEYDLEEAAETPGQTQDSSERGEGSSQYTSRRRRPGIPYQTLVGSILHRYVRRELVDLKAADLAALLERAS